MDPATAGAPGGCSSLIRCPRHLLTSSSSTSLVCSHRPCLSSCLLPPFVSCSHHRLSTVVLHHLSAGQRHQAIASCLVPKLVPNHLLSAAIISSCLPPLYSLMADCQVIMCQPQLPNHPLLSASKAVIATPLVSSRCLCAGSARRAVI